MAKVGKALGNALLPVGVFLTAGSMLTGGMINPAIGLAGVATGALLKYFFCSKARVEKLHQRLLNAQREFEDAQEYVNNI